MKGHKSTFCQEDKIDRSELNKRLDQAQISGYEKVICFGCGLNGHY